MLLSLIIIAIGFALLIFGANWLVDGACNIAARLGVPERVAGLTIVAIGTSLPELVVSVTSAVAGHADMAFGNVVGSCLANLLLILGLAAVVKPITLSRSTQRFEIPVSVLACGLLALLTNTDGQLTMPEGIILLVAFGLFVARTVKVGLEEGSAGQSAEDLELEEEFEEEGKSSNIIRDLLFIGLGIAMLKFGADFVVDNATSIAAAMGISERIIGLTVVALGTCLPELVTSVVAAMRGNSDIAVGNVVGSNISNLLLVMGGPALFANIPYDVVYNVDLVLLAVFSLMLVGFAFIGRRHEMSRANGVVFVVLYAAYIATSLLR